MRHFLVTDSFLDSQDAVYSDERLVIIFSGYSDDVKRISNDLIYDTDYRIKKEIERCENDNDRLFLLAIYYLTEGNNKRKSAKAILEKLPPDAYNGQATLLLLDCNLRLGIRMDYHLEYQRLLDRAQNPLMKKLIKTHYRFYKYEDQELLLDSNNS